ncbi:chemotaxis protein CheR [candidate division KSB1 bacterium 4572_119]|nr:MAG: chemotaxis protein CheR [candidate division KSB1 bacterium 4572_119]
MGKIENENIEIELLLEAIYQKYGYDFRKYSRASIKRRILHRLAKTDLDSVSEMQHRLLYDVEFFDKLLLDLSVNVTEMFRDPNFYLDVRKEVFPVLKTYPYLKIWHAGCATGEEVYSLAIMLREEGLYDRALIYATDFNEVVLKKAKQGIIPLNEIQKYTANYQKAGGKESFADYYTAKYNSALIDQSLKKNIVFSDHNLATDGVFGEMNLIFCRNVLIYFKKELQNRVIGLFRESLCNLGFLCLGSKESLMFSEYEKNFEPTVKETKIFRKIS